MFRVCRYIDSYIQDECTYKYLFNQPAVTSSARLLVSFMLAYNP